MTREFNGPTESDEARWVVQGFPSLCRNHEKIKNANATTYEEVREMDWEKL